jgi:SAM-dependent methyltransferase
MLLYGMTETDLHVSLSRWMEKAPNLHEFVPDLHRIQLEKWIWDRRPALGDIVMDVGVQSARRWVGPGYFTVGFKDCDVAGDLLDLPLRDGLVDGVILTEVLEHCVNPFRAVDEVYRVLKPGGTLLVTSPFFWPWHGTDDYPDFWRFTDQAWQLLLSKFDTMKIRPCEWTKEGAVAYDMMRRFECMGMRAFTRATTGYLAEAVK